MGRTDRRSGKPEGTCRLTGESGPFIDSHIIPKALTRAGVRGAKFIQISEEGRSTSRPRSWFDGRLVTDKGEAILSRIDNAACQILRQHKLVWSSWSGDRLDTDDHHISESTGHGIRRIENIDKEALRLFIYSLLWRAGATILAEFSEVDIPLADLEKLKRIVLGQETADALFYPATFVQISTIGVIHNHVPLAEVLTVPNLDRPGERRQPIYRFYFDGLVVHVHRPESDVTLDDIGVQIVAGRGGMTLPLVPYETSIQRSNLEALALGSGLAIPPRGWGGRI